MSNEAKGVVFKGSIEGVSTRADKTIKLIIGTQEMGGDTGIRILNMHQYPAHIYISPIPIPPDAKKHIDFESAEAARGIMNDPKKSPSQRLRAVLWNIHNGTATEEPFDVFYEKQMENIISHFKQKLD